MSAAGGVGQPHGVGADVCFRLHMGAFQTAQPADVSQLLQYRFILLLDPLLGSPCWCAASGATLLTDEGPLLHHSARWSKPRAVTPDKELGL